MKVRHFPVVVRLRATYARDAFVHGGAKHGERMIVSNSLMRRRADLDLAQFCAHWLEPHGALAARLPGCRHYVQNHIVDGPGTNAFARALRIDGIPQLAFDSPQARLAAHGSEALKACDRDSELFVGAVSRVITEIPAPVDFVGPPGTLKQMLLFVPALQDARPPSPPRSPDDVIRALVGVRRHVVHVVQLQTRAPGSNVASLDIPVDGLCELWLDDLDAVKRNAAVLDTPGGGIASFAVTVHPFL
jgi:uncharacterized protein (TIGR02118 family)